MTTLSAREIDKNTVSGTMSNTVSGTVSNTVPGTMSEGFFELVLSEGRRMDNLVLDEGRLPTTVTRLLLLSLAGLAVYGAVVGLAAEASTLSAWFNTGAPILWMPLAFSGAFLAAIGISLPSFYFYTQLSGLDASFRLITAQALRVQARTSVVLLGVLPFYAALALGVGLGFDLGLGANGVLMVGLFLPFVVGFVGIATLYRSFKRLVHRLPITHERRGNIMLRLVLCWGAVFSAIAPVALWRLGEFLGTVL